MGLFGNFLILVDRQRLRGLRVGKATMVLQALQLIDSPMELTLDGIFERKPT